eukprot:10078908-Alexandrium_andersonii.AAC.1
MLVEHCGQTRQEAAQACAELPSGKLRDAFEEGIVELLVVATHVLYPGPGGGATWLRALCCSGVLLVSGASNFSIAWARERESSVTRSAPRTSRYTTP